MWEDIATSFPPPPRIVRRKSGTGCAVAFPRLFMLPHMLVGIGLLLSIPGHLYVFYFGTPVTAHIDQVNYSFNKKGGGSYDVKYHYILNGRRIDDDTGRSEREGAKLHSGDTFPGRAATILYHDEFIPASESIQDDITGLATVALIWNGLMSIFVYIVWYIPMRDRRLVRFGEAAPGVITKLWQTTGRGAACHAQYEFTTPAGETITRKKREVNSLAYLQTREGDVITVLHNPAKPKQSLPYELSDFEIVGSMLG